MVYVTSRVENYQKAKEVLEQNALETSSSWLELADNEVFGDIWTKFREDMRKADVLLALIYEDDAKMSGGLIELGMAYAEGIPIVIYAEKIAGTGLTTFRFAKNVFVYDDLEQAVAKVKELNVVNTERFVFQQIKKEVEYQSAKWGGYHHDVRHSNRDWLFFYERYLAMAKDNEWLYSAKQDLYAPQIQLAAMIVSNLRSNYCPTVVVAPTNPPIRRFDLGVAYQSNPEK